MKMSLINGSSVSAFAIYKQKESKQTKPSINQLSPPKKKKKLFREVEFSMKATQKPLSDSITSARKHKKIKSTSKNRNGVQKIKNQESMKMKKQNRKVKKKDNDNNESDDEPPPLLVPIHMNGIVKKRKQLAISEEIEKNSAKRKLDEGVTELISDLHKTDPSPEGLKLFKWMIASVSPSEFFDQFWEKEILVVERNSPNYFSELLTTERLDNIFREFPLYYTRNVDVVSYEDGIKKVHNEEGKVVASSLYDYYSNGCSIRVLNPQTYDQKVHLLIATLQEFFGNMVGTNVYLTPPGSQGFAPHFDDIEAFILQLEGRKHWKLYKPKESDILARNSSHNFSREELSSPIMEVTLNAGDLLYFPRGTIHEGRTDENAHSLHITVSVYQHTSYVDLLEHIVPEALKKASIEDVSFRRGLPLNFLKHLGYVNSDAKSEERQSVINKVQYLMQEMIKYIDVDKAADKLGRKFMYDSMPPVLSKQEVRYTSKYDGEYMQEGKIFNKVEISMDTEVRLVRYHSLRLVMEEDSAKIYYNTDNAKVYHGEEEQFLIVDDNLIPCIKELQNIYPHYIEVENLPGDDNISKAQLVSSLWERGLLVTKGPLESFTDDEDCDDMSDEV